MTENNIRPAAPENISIEIDTKKKTRCDTREKF